MRHVRIPAPIQVCGIWISLGDFVRDLLDRDDRFTKALAGIRAATRIETALAGDEPSGVLDESDWVLLKAVVEEPMGGYMTLVQQNASGVPVKTIAIARALLPFIEAIVGAEKALKVVSQEEAG